jgi:hypothetical protein
VLPRSRSRLHGYDLVWSFVFLVPCAVVFAAFEERNDQGEFIAAALPRRLRRFMAASAIKG